MEFTDFKKKWKAFTVLEEKILEGKNIRVTIKMLYNEEMVCIVEKIKIEEGKVVVLERIVFDQDKIDDLKILLNKLYNY